MEAEGRGSEPGAEGSQQPQGSLPPPATPVEGGGAGAKRKAPGKRAAEPEAPPMKVSDYVQEVVMLPAEACKVDENLEFGQVPLSACDMLHCALFFLGGEALTLTNKP